LLWYNIKNKPVTYFPYELKYIFKSEIETDAYIASEDIGDITVNGQPVNFSEGHWIDNCFSKAKIRIKAGENVIIVKNHLSGISNIEAVYILGDFAVYDGVIKEKPEIIKPGDITKQGYPFYSGKITYIFKKEIKQMSLLRFDNLCGAAAINVNSKTVAWHPYQVIVDPCDEIRVELVLTRRNTFGPLHAFPHIVDGCSPRSFVTEGENYREQPVLIPCGFGIDR
jgi:hypothetical protein